MADNIKVDPGTGDSSPLVATRTLTVNSVPTVEVPYGILGVEAAGALVPVDSAHPLPVSGTVAVSNFPTTQPVSATSLPLPAGAATEASLAGAVAYLATIAGAGPVSGTVAVSNFPATQPVSGAVSVSNFPASQAVTGTFWQSTQPVSGTVAVSNLPATQPVSGTFWQTTQPVSGTFWQSTQPVSLASLPALAAGTNTIGVVNAQQAGDVIEIAGTTYAVKRAFANATASGETTVVAAVVSKKIRVLAYAMGPVSAAVNVYFDNATDGAITSTKYLAANGGMGRAFSPFGHFQTGTVNEALRVNLSVTANAGIDLLYIEV